MMKTDDFIYHLPPENIAQTPVNPRDASRLLVLNRETGALQHVIFRQLPEYLEPGDLLVVNETRVIPARIYARKLATGGRVEILLLSRKDDLTWECLVGGKGLTAGRQLLLEGGPAAQVVQVLDGPRRLLRFEQVLDSYLAQVGQMPLPPYIHTPLADPERYQTVYARQPGSAAAPTAGLHFTPALLDRIRESGVGLTTVTLHVGLDTFAPVTEDSPEEHKIHTEWCQLTQEASDLINKTRQHGGRVIAVGTTSVRTLESAARQTEPGQAVSPFCGPTDLYILPGYSFRVVDAMVTNFHLPRSSLIMLVSAFAGREKILATYRSAIQAGYRFYSFGDAMLIL
jgi:S-adenosylmethionine:tRNA ribosyltransferase-isomerase